MVKRATRAALGWTNGHLHEFVIGGVRYSDPDPDMDEDLQQDERKVLLREAMGMGTRCFDYVYDFGDDWHHVVVVEDQHITVHPKLPGTRFGYLEMCTTP